MNIVQSSVQMPAREKEKGQEEVRIERSYKRRITSHQSASLLPPPPAKRDGRNGNKRIRGLGVGWWG